MRIFTHNYWLRTKLHTLLHLLLTLASSNIDWKKDSTSSSCLTTKLNPFDDDLLVLEEKGTLCCSLLFFLGAGGHFWMMGILLLDEVGVLHSSNSWTLASFATTTLKIIASDPPRLESWSCGGSRRCVESEDMEFQGRVC